MQIDLIVFGFIIPTVMIIVLWEVIFRKILLRFVIVPLREKAETRQREAESKKKKNVPNGRAGKHAPVFDSHRHDQVHHQDEANRKDPHFDYHKWDILESRKKRTAANMSQSVKSVKGVPDNRRTNIRLVHSNPNR